MHLNVVSALSKGIEDPFVVQLYTFVMWLVAKVAKQIRIECQDFLGFEGI